MTKTQIAVNAFCLLFALGSLAALVWTIATGQVHDLDGIFFVLTCLLFILLFAIIPVQALRAGQYRQLFNRKKAAEPAQDKSDVGQTASQKS
jgi:hypothetical protein